MLARNLRYDFRSRLPKNTLSFPSFNLKYDKNELGRLQVGVVVSKKVDKRATARNRLKRVLLGELTKQVSKDTALTAVFYIKKGVQEEVLKEDLLKALSKTAHKIEVQDK